MLYIKRTERKRDSQLVKSFGYRAGNLDIEFPDGSIYRYFFAPKKLVRGMKETKSAGKYFVKKIFGRYPYKRLA